MSGDQFTLADFLAEASELLGEWRGGGKQTGTVALGSTEHGYITNGRTLIVRPLPWPGEVPAECGIDMLEKMLQPERSNWETTMAADALREWCAGPIGTVAEECATCNGACMCECDCGNVHTCGACEGEGTQTSDPEPRPGMFGALAFDRVLVARALGLLESVGILDLLVTASQMQSSTVQYLLIRCSTGTALIAQMDTREVAGAEAFPAQAQPEMRTGE